MWCFKDDKTKPVITSFDQIDSLENIQLPKTAVVLYMRELEFIQDKYNVELITNDFPRFLNACPIYKIKGQNEICFLDGGRGAPMAADTIETLHAFGVKSIISVGQIGCFSPNLQIGDIVIPNKAYVEEGTSLHYYENIEYSTPSSNLFHQITKQLPHQCFPIVSCDAIYRQTFYKEQLWREKGCVGVDMETSALMSVGKYLNMDVVSVLMVSDIHPMNEHQQWHWHMTKELRKKLLYQVIDFALS